MEESFISYRVLESYLKKLNESTRDKIIFWLEGSVVARCTRDIWTPCISYIGVQTTWYAHILKLRWCYLLYILLYNWRDFFSIIFSFQDDVTMEVRASSCATNSTTACTNAIAGTASYCAKTDTVVMVRPLMASIYSSGNFKGSVLSREDPLSRNFYMAFGSWIGGSLCLFCRNFPK